MSKEVNNILQIVLLLILGFALASLLSTVDGEWTFSNDSYLLIIILKLLRMGFLSIFAIAGMIYLEIKKNKQ